MGNDGITMKLKTLARKSKEGDIVLVKVYERDGRRCYKDASSKRQQQQQQQTTTKPATEHSPPIAQVPVSLYCKQNNRQQKTKRNRTKESASDRLGEDLSAAGRQARQLLVFQTKSDTFGGRRVGRVRVDAHFEGFAIACKRKMRRKQGRRPARNETVGRLTVGRGGCGAAGRRRKKVPANGEIARGSIRRLSSLGAGNGYEIAGAGHIHYGLARRLYRHKELAGVRHRGVTN